MRSRNSDFSVPYSLQHTVTNAEAKTSLPDGDCGRSSANTTKLGTRNSELSLLYPLLGPDPFRFLLTYKGSYG